MKKYPSQVSITEVGPRDGLQNESQIISTDSKLEFIHNLVEAGATQIEVTSFVSPQWVPQMKDAFELYQKIQRKPGVRYIALVPNKHGMRRALEAEVNAIAVFTAASESFTQRNIHSTIDESFEHFHKILPSAQENKIWIRGYVSTAFVCPYEGYISPQKVCEVSKRLFDEGIEELSLGDTIGAATPNQVEDLIEVLSPHVPLDKIALHFHDTRGTALANVLKGMELGITKFDSSAGGLGGCPYAPGASGNLATEDLLYMLNGMKIETGIDLDQVFQISKQVEQMLNKKLPSKYLQAGKLNCNQ